MADIFNDAIWFIAKRSGMRESAVDKWLKENKINPNKMAKYVSKMNLKQALGLSVAFVGKEKVMKAAIEKIKKEIK